jgi:phosphoglycolate phosphatase-like HAD superfamily hydrolase
VHSSSTALSWTCLQMPCCMCKANVDACQQHSRSPCPAGVSARRPLEGVREWLDTLGRFNVPCALVSALDRATVQAALARMTLHDHFQVTVIADKRCALNSSLLCIDVHIAQR